MFWRRSQGDDETCLGVQDSGLVTRGQGDGAWSAGKGALFLGRVMGADAVLQKDGRKKRGRGLGRKEEGESRERRDGAGAQVHLLHSAKDLGMSSRNV